MSTSTPLTQYRSIAAAHDITTTFANVTDVHPSSIVMGGTSPGTFQSPSFHSSSYLPKMEANFMKDYVCCGLQLASLHELLQHYEQSHAVSEGPSLPRTSNPSQGGAAPANVGRAAESSGNMGGQQNSQLEAVNTQYGFNLSPNMQVNLNRNFGNQFETKHNGAGVQGPGLDEVEPLDMEMDDSISASQLQQQRNVPQSNQQLSGHNPPQLAPLNLNLANAFHHQGLRTSTPTTPHANNQAFSMQHNPTVSSVNTPTLATFQQQQNRGTPDSSYPGTPEQPDQGFGDIYGNMSMNTQLAQGLDDFSGAGLNNVGTGLAGSDQQFIDQPAKRLYSRTGGQASQQTNGQGSNSTDIAKMMREQQITAGVSSTGTTMGLLGEEHKPFRCPVIGCEKAYKNQNGLKYHKQVCFPLTSFSANRCHYSNTGSKRNANI